MSKFKTIDDLDFSNKTVLLRADLNVPVDDNFNVTDTTRIDRTVPTILELMEKGAKVVVCAHFGRPKGEFNEKYSLKPIAKPLEDGLKGKAKVVFAKDCVGQDAKQAVANLKQGEVLLLENLRFHKEEKKNDEAFAEKLAELADIYVSDAFSVAHRAHASTQAVVTKMPSVAGRLMQAELEALENALANPQRPVAAVVGGAKVSTKLELLSNMIEKVDLLIIGGGMANTFLYAKGIDVGNSLCEKDMASTAKEIMEKAEKIGCKIMLPEEVVVAKEFAENAENKTVSINSIPSDMMVLDVSTLYAKDLAVELESCKTLVWNGPLGAFEIKPFDEATNVLAQAAASRTKKGKLLTVAGGGDTVSALANAGVDEDFSYISTAGGAFLEWLEGKTLPGVKALEDAK